MGKNTKTIEEKYKSLTPEEHVLHRPGTYIGSTVTEDVDMFILDDGRFVKKTVKYNPGFIKLFDEIISNSVDESKRSGSKLDTIKVEVDTEKNTIQVYDNGGIEVVMHKEVKKYVPHLLFGELRSGSNFTDSDSRTWVGTNGLGSALCNIFSEEFKVETADSKHRFTMTWKDNMSKNSDAKIDNTSQHYTRITYKPDLKRFGMSCIDNDSFKIMEKRVYEIAGCNVNLTIYFNGKRIVMKSFKDYCQMYINEGDLLLYEENKDWQVGLSVSPTGSFQQVSYVNCVNTFDGGTHNDHILNQIIPALREKISKKFKTDILPGQIKNHMFLFINSTIINPAFSSQTKEKLITDIKNFGTEIKLTDKFINSIYKSEITNSITDWLDQKKVADEKKAEREANKAISKVKVDKLIDCKWAGTDKKDKCRLILTEGDSAMSAYRANRDPNVDAGLPLRGKSLNVRDLPKSKVMENVEIMAVMAAMGLKFGESPIKFDKNGNVVEDKTRFGTIQIYTDADVDGTACAALILNYIHKFWPDLIRAHKIARAETPVLIVEHKKTKKEKWFYYDSEYKEWSEGKDLKDYDIHYMKGLGALNGKQSAEIYKNPHLYFYELDDFAEESMQHWFGKDSEMRKKKLA
jgi:DNA topoisomerase-2